MIRYFISCSAAVGLCATGIWGQVGIERIAPEDTVLLLDVDNMAQTIERAKKSGFADIWHAPELEDVRLEMMQSLEEGLEQFFTQIGLDESQLKTPTGAVGLAVFLAAREDDPDARQIAALAIADFGDDAAEMDDIVRAVLSQAEVENDLHWDEIDVRGREVLAIDLPQEEVVEEEEEFAFAMGPDWDAIFGRPSKVHYVRDGGILYLCTDINALDDALSVADGEKIEGLAEREDFSALQGMVGEHDVSITVLTRGLKSLLMQDQQAAMGLPMVEPIYSAMFGKIDGFSYGVSLDHPEAMVEITSALLLLEGKEGLFDLADQNVPRGAVPPFVSQDASSFMTANVEFDGVMELIRQVIGAAPVMIRGQVEDGFTQVAPDMEKFFDALGTQLYSASTIERPITAESQKTLFALECRDPQSLEDLLDNYGEQMGLESRDFLGHRIYTSEFPLLPMPGMMGGGDGMSIGIGAGAMLVGSTSAVEQVLRSAGEGDVETLDDNAAFARAISVLPHDEAVAWGYSNLIDQIEYAIGASWVAQADLIEQLREWDPDAADEAAAEFADAQPMMGLDPDFFRRYIGSMVWQISSTDEGYVLHSFIMPPADEEF